MSLRNQIVSALPVSGEGFTIKFISEFDYMLITKSRENQPTDQWTCRPIHTPPQSFSELNDAYTRIIENGDRGDFGIYQGQDIVGRIQIFDYNSRNQSAEIGYYMVPEFRGKSFMSKALKLFMETAFSTTELNKLTAQTAEFNVESISLLKKLGFKEDGRLRQHHELNGELKDDLIFSILRSEI